MVTGLTRKVICSLVFSVHPRFGTEMSECLGVQDRDRRRGMSGPTTPGKKIKCVFVGLDCRRGLDVLSIRLSTRFPVREGVGLGVGTGGPLVWFRVWDCLLGLLDRGTECPSTRRDPVVLRRFSKSLESSNSGFRRDLLLTGVLYRMSFYEKLPNVLHHSSNRCLQFPTLYSYLVNCEL